MEDRNTNLEREQANLWKDLCVKKLEYDLPTVDEMIKWDHFIARILQGYFLTFMSIWET